MDTDSIVISGVPVDNLDLDQTLARLFSMPRAYDEDGRPRLAVAATAEIIMRLRQSAAGETESPANPEASSSFLIKTLRHADMVIPIGRPISWAARILGAKLKHTISLELFFRSFLENACDLGKDIVLVKKTGHGDGAFLEIFFLTQSGRQEPNGEPTPRLLKTTAENLHETINSAGIDFLVVDITDPEIAKWFEVSGNLVNIPVILLMPETTPLSEAANKSARTTHFSRKRGVMTFFKNLYRNYIGFGLMLLPLAISQKYYQAMFNLTHRRSMIPSFRSVGAQPVRGMSIRVISMPDPLDASITGDIRAKISQMSKVAPKIVLDFSRVNFMDSSGLGLLMGLFRMSSPEHRELFLTGVKQRIYNFFKLTRTTDFFEGRIMEDLDTVVEAIKKRISSASFYYLALIRNNAVVFNFYGKLDSAAILDLDPQTLVEPAEGKDVILNLSELDIMDEAGLRLLVKFHRHVSKNNRLLVACGIPPKVRRMLSVYGVDRFLMTERDMASAELALRRRHIRHLVNNDELVKSRDRTTL